MLVVDAVPAGRHLEVLRQALVEPERHVLEDAVQQGVRQLVAQVLADAVAPVGVDEQVLGRRRGGRGWATKNARRFGRSGYLSFMKLLVALAVLEEVDLDDACSSRGSCSSL